MTQATCECGTLRQKTLETLLFIKEVLLNPANQFRNMPRQGGFIEPLIAIAALGLLAGILRVLVTFYYMVNGAEVGLFTALSSIITTPITVVAFCYIGAFLLSVAMKLLGADSSLETAFRVTSYLAIVSPAAVILTAIPYIGNIVVLAVLAYLLVIAAIEVYQLKSNTAWMVFGIGFAALALLSVVSDYRRQPQPDTVQPAAIETQAPEAHH
nr:YIP1 family protein [uncultured Desulfuromonas sp.]